MTAAEPNATGSPGYSETMPCDAESVGRARRLVAGSLGAWGLGDLVDASTLVVSELVANAVKHARCLLFHVAVRRLTDHSVLVFVADRSRDVPRMTCSSDDSEDGRGLVLVDALSDRWGYERHRSGKTVWAELRLKAEDPEQ
ncbi:ATP-binding protein [Streptomyces sp. NPDC050509]|uniref:ATP-binding protein n=1 Tax=Streptomyces sp. NPDC050509 TaxID=3365620 RepID=UPI0037A6CB6D